MLIESMPVQPLTSVTVTVYVVLEATVATGMFMAASFKPAVGVQLIVDENGFVWHIANLILGRLPYWKYC